MFGLHFHKWKTEKSHYANHFIRGVLVKRVYVEIQRCAICDKIRTQKALVG